MVRGLVNDVYIAVWSYLGFEKVDGVFRDEDAVKYDRFVNDWRTS